MQSADSHFEIFRGRNLLRLVHVHHDGICISLPIGFHGECSFLAGIKCGWDDDIRSTFGILLQVCVNKDLAVVSVGASATNGTTAQVRVSEDSKANGYFPFSFTHTAGVVLHQCQEQLHPANNLQLDFGVFRILREIIGAAPCSFPPPFRSHRDAFPLVVEDTANVHTSVVQYKVFKGHPKGAIVSLLEIQFLLHLLRPAVFIIVAPFALPFSATPRIPQLNQSMSINLFNSEQGIGMALHNPHIADVSVFASTRTTTQQMPIVIEAFQCGPHRSVVDLLLGFFIMQTDLATHASCHVNQAIVDKSSFNRIIGAMKLCVGFLNDLNPAL
mmetsp:Transcript_56195/g.122908  ORF Transcript_56195/g.122908 Transcript_56195/m.122908 type:complete len:329 (-) Transcript_56195:691-1677(-)